MNKIMWIVLIIVIIGGVYFLTQNPSQPVAQPSITQQLPTASPTTQAEANTVSISNFTFSPSMLRVKTGTTVTWINNDSTTHTIKSTTFNSSNLSPGDKFSFTFSTKGTFDYSCGIHPSMTGQIVVE